MTRPRLEFTFHQCLGKGGFGEVYLATVRRTGGLKQRVAVKVLKEGLPNEGEAVQRLRDEGAMLATLNHPAILTVHDLCRITGRISLVCEYIEGIDLARCAKPGRLLPERVVVSAIGEVASALDSAWNTISPETGRPLQLIHRDLKPENIRISVHGQIKLLDFGIARTTEILRHAHTQAGDLPFTPGYAAPESFVLGEQGPASDVYALGVTLYRMLVGERLYDGMDIASQVQVAARPERYAPWITGRLDNVPARGDLRNLVGNLLSYEPERRMSSSQLAEACEHLSDRLEGPTLSRWARSVKFPPPRNVKGASLTGKTLADDGLVSEVHEGGGRGSFGPALPRPTTDERPRPGSPPRAPPPGEGLKGRHTKTVYDDGPLHEQSARRPSSPPPALRQPSPPPEPIRQRQPTPSGATPRPVSPPPALRQSGGRPPTPPPPPTFGGDHRTVSPARGAAPPTPVSNLRVAAPTPPPPLPPAGLRGQTIVAPDADAFDDAPGPPPTDGPSWTPVQPSRESPTRAPILPSMPSSAETPSRSILSVTLNDDTELTPARQRVEEAGGGGRSTALIIVLLVGILLVGVGLLGVGVTIVAWLAFAA